MTIPPDQPNDCLAPRGERFSRLLVAHSHRIYGFIFALVHDHAATNDILQEVSAVLWRKFDRFDPGTDFGAWAMSVARLSVFEWRRAQKNFPLQLDDEQLSFLADEAMAVGCEFESRREALRGCMEKLAAGDRDLLAARYREEQSVQAIADRVHRTRMAIYKRLDKLHTLLLDCIARRLAAEGRRG
jgi:RNA polymerase sigma-70 factor (ECF subfamily)